MEDNKNPQAPTESQVKTLLSDWLCNLRQGEDGNFIHRGKGGIRSSRKADEYLLGNIESFDIYDLMKASRKAARNIVGIIVSKPVEVIAGTNSSYNTGNNNGKQTICLATDYFDDYSLSKREMACIMLGLAAHEAAHGVYTNMDEHEARLDTAPSPEAKDLLHNIWNILEDERIEYLLGEDRPGLAPLLGNTKEYYFSRLVKRMKDSNGEMPQETIPRFLAVLAQAVRYPSELTEKDVTENFEDLDEVRKILTPYPLDDEGCWKASQEIFNLLLGKIKQEMKQEDPSMGQVLGQLAHQMSSQEAVRVLQALQEDNDKANAGNCSNEFSQDTVMKYVNDDDSSRENTDSGTFFVVNPEENRTSYTESLNRVRQYVPAVSKVLACKTHEKDFVLRGMPSGKLNPNKLCTLAAGNKNVFTKQGRVKTSAVSVCLLIDESGSMSSNNRVGTARDAAVLVSEAVMRMKNVRFYCYGYTTKQLTVYAEKQTVRRNYRLGSTDATHGTPTGDAMELSFNRIRKITQDPILMLVLTDGCADNSAKVIEMDSRLSKNGVTVIGVGIQHSAVEQTFKNNVVLHNLKDFALKIGKLTKGKLDKMIVRSIEQ